MESLAYVIRRFIRILLVLTVIIVAWFSYEFLLPRESFSGIAQVVDGDTIVVKNIRVRLYGIDAPEAGQ